MKGAVPLRVLLVAADTAGSDRWSEFATADLDVQRATSLAAAAEWVDASTIDAVVVDAAIASSNESAVRRLQQNTSLPLLLVSDQTNGKNRGLAKRLNAEDHLSPGSAARRLRGLQGSLTADRDRLAHELEQSRARFRDVIEHNADAIVVVDHVGHIQYANPMAVRWFGSARSELVGSAFGFPLVAGETTELDLVTNGSARIVEMRVVESAWEGQPAFIASLRDVTDRKRAEDNSRRLIREQAARAAAERAARRFRFLAECSSVLSTSLDYNVTLAALAKLCVGQLADWTIIYVIDDHGELRRLEIAHRDPEKSQLAAQIHDFPLTEQQRKPLVDLLDSRTPVLSGPLDEAALRSIISDHRHIELLRELGIGSYMLVPLIARDRPVGAIALINADSTHIFDNDDVTLAQDLALRAGLAMDNARLYQEAQEANRTKAEFIAVLSHDMRTPLASIIGYAELLQMGIPESIPQSSWERVDRIGTAARHLLYLIDQLLMFARLDAHHDEPQLLDVNVKALVHDVAAVIEPLAHKRGLRFEVEIPDTMDRMRTDPDKLRQILVNLLGNAVKYTHDGTVRLAVRQEADRRIAFEVSDTGIGIASEHLDQIFVPFWQADSTMRARPGGGTGLGLSVVQRLIKSLRGEVKVQSGLGVGSTFVVRLPGYSLPGTTAST